MARIPRISPMASQRMTSEVTARKVDINAVDLPDRMAIEAGKGISEVGKLVESTLLQSEKMKADASYSSRIMQLEQQRAKDDDLSAERDAYYNSELNKARADSLSHITIPQQRGLKDIEYGTHQETAAIKLNSIKQGKVVDQAIANFGELTYAKKSEFLNEPNSARKVDILKGTINQIDVLEANMVIDKAKAQQMKVALYQDWVNADTDAMMERNPADLANEMSKKEGEGMFPLVKQEDRVKIKNNALAKIKTNEDVQIRNEAIARVRPTADILTKIGKGEIKTAELPDLARKIYTSNPSLAVALQTIYANDGAFDPPSGEETDYKDAMAYILSDQSLSQDELYGRLTQALSQNQGRPLSITKLTSLVNAVNEKAKLLPVIAQDAPPVPDAKAVQNHAELKNISLWATLHPTFPMIETVMNYQKYVADGKSAKEAKNMAMKVTSERYNPNATKYEVGKSYTLPNGHIFLVENIDNNGVPQGKIQ